jgi:hypothetical protein
MNRKHRSLIIFGTLLCALLLGTLYIFVPAHHSPYRYLLERHRAEIAPHRDVSYISKWMTFDYINTLFGVPESYLQDTLAIHDTRYPFLTVEQYANEQHLDKKELTQRIQELVHEYIDKRNTK